MKTLKSNFFIATVIIACTLMGIAPAWAQKFDASIGHRSLVFDRNMEGSKFYRIPALVATPAGTLVAVADKRIDDNSDLPGRIDVVCRRSQDGGQTWGPMITIAAHDDNGGYGDPALAYDPVRNQLVSVFTHGEGLPTATDGNGARIMVSHSSDDGLTWSQPLDITDSLYSGSAGQGPVKATTVFATSGRMATLKDGRIMFALIVRPLNSPRWGKLQVYPVWSSDGGYTWQIGPNSVDDNADESKIIELADGNLLMSIRNRDKGCRKFAVSQDGGTSWSEPWLAPTLIEPACNGDIINYTREGKEYLLHTIPYHPSQRTDVSILCSEDNGRTWEPVIEVCPTASAYSSLTEMPDGSGLGILTEEACSDGGFRLWFTKINIR